MVKACVYSFKFLGGVDRAMRIVRLTGSVALALIVVLALCLAWRFFAPISTPQFRGSDGKILPESIAVIERWPVNGMMQSVIIRGRDRSSPILLVVHGGPGSSETGPLRHYDAALEDHFVMVYWDQRYAGQNFDGRLPIPKSPTINEYVSDLGVVVDDLRSRFGRNKIGILAHSWGTILGVLYAEQHPEKLYAYVGVGQVANVPESEKRSYAFALSQARQRHMAKAIKALEKIGPPPRPGLPIYTPRDWLERLGGMYHGPLNTQRLIWASVQEPEINGRDLMAFLHAGDYSKSIILGEMTAFVIDNHPQNISVPVFILAGRDDRQSEATVAYHFYEQVRAPRKAFVWFELSGHNPMFEQPSAFVDWMTKNVAPLGERGKIER